MGLEGFDTKKHIPEKHLFHMSCCALTMQEEKEHGCEVIWDRVQAAPWRWDAGNGMKLNPAWSKQQQTNTIQTGKDRVVLIFIPFFLAEQIRLHTIEWCYICLVVNSLIKDVIQIIYDSIVEYDSTSMGCSIGVPCLNLSTR